jgi:hypothetical protein
MLSTNNQSWIIKLFVSIRAAVHFLFENKHFARSVNTKLKLLVPASHPARVEL